MNLVSLLVLFLTVLYVQADIWEVPCVLDTVQAGWETPCCGSGSSWDMGYCDANEFTSLCKYLERNACY
jgi:hypothetical protein